MKLGNADGAAAEGSSHMAGSCYVSLGLWSGIQVGGERPTLVGAQCLGESGLEKISKRVRGSGCRDRKGTGSPQRLPPPPCPPLPQGHLALCPSPRACGESTPPNTTLVWPPGQSWLLPWWVGNGQPFHPPMPEAGSSKPISGYILRGCLLQNENLWHTYCHLTGLESIWWEII